MTSAHTPKHFSSIKCEFSGAVQAAEKKSNDALLWLIAICLLLPLFVQLSSGIYNSVTVVTDSGGQLNKLPLPISIGACFIGILLLANNYRNALPALVFMLSLAAAMLLSSISTSTESGLNPRKVILGAQFLLPTMGVFLGQLVIDGKKIIPKAFLLVLALLVPLQLFAGFLQNTMTLTHYLYVFSIYQHFQFVPVVFVAAFCVVMANMYGRQKRLLCGLTVIMGVYVLASASFLAIGLYGIFVFSFFLKQVSQRQSISWMHALQFLTGIAVAIALAGGFYKIAQKNTSIVGDYGQYVGKFLTIAQGKMPTNITERFEDWRRYGRGIAENGGSVLFGQAEPPLREVRTSAHNWYLDFVYNFGMVSLLPVLTLIFFTGYLTWINRTSLPAETFWLAGVVAFLVLIDSNFKVMLRQPYPGIFTYFLWGLLLSRLRLQTQHKASI